MTIKEMSNSKLPKKPTINEKDKEKEFIEAEKQEESPYLPKNVDLEIIKNVLLVKENSIKVQCKKESKLIIVPQWCSNEVEVQ